MGHLPRVSLLGGISMLVAATVFLKTSVQDLQRSGPGLIALFSIQVRCFIWALCSD